MDNFIIVNLTLFSLDQSIFISQNGTITSKKCLIEEIPETVIGLCKEFDINRVQINGNYMYGNKIADEIIKNERINYSKNTINVEVI